MHNFQRGIVALGALALAASLSLPALADQPTYYYPPKFKSQVKPSYPESARAAREAGTVFVKVLVGADGVAKSFTIKSSGHKDLDAEVMKAAKASKYTPATRNGKAVMAFYDFSYKFTLAGLAENEGSDSELAKRLSQDPKNVSTRLALTEFYINKGDFSNAESTAQEGVKANPNDARLWAQLGRAYYQDGSAKKDMGKLKQAADAYDKALSMGSGGQYSSQAAAVYAEYGFNLMQAQQYNDCLPYADKAAQLNSKQMQYRMLKGDCEEGALNHAAALADYKAAQALDDKKSLDMTARLLADIGNVQLTMNDEADGLASLNAAQKAAPHSGFAYQYLASYYIRKGNLNAALNPLLQLAQIQPDNSQVQINIGDIYVRQKNFAAAQTAYNKALTTDPKSADAQFGLAELAAAQGNIAGTDAALHKAIGMAPANSATYNAAIATLFLAATTDKVDHSGDAAKYAQAATVADPNYANGWYTLAIAYADQKKKDQANSAFRKAFDLFKAKNDQAGMKAVNDQYMALNGKDNSLMTDKARTERTNQPGY